MTLYYAGVGSRKTPATILDWMTRAAKRLKELGWVLRSGCAEGADSAFEAGAEEAAELFIPWNGFRGRWLSEAELIALPTAAAFELASQVHPAWSKLSRGAAALHARNCHQILGPNLDNPVHFCLCYTPDGAEAETECSITTGGTATAIRVASYYNIPVFNLANEDAITRLAAAVNAAKN